MSRNAVNTQPYQRCVAITTSDANNISTGVTDAIFITTAGNIVFIDEAGNSTTVTAATIGQIYPIRVIRVLATGTTATASALYYTP